MMKELEKTKRAGNFKLFSGKEIYGELTFAGANTSLYLRDSERFEILPIEYNCIKGILHDLTKVTLFHCIPRIGTCSGAIENSRYYYSNIFPHFVLLGDHYINIEEKTITEVNFVIDDAITLFYDFDAFGSLIDAKPFIDQIVNANALRLEREILTGPNPQILYFSGKREIVTTETILGKVTVKHNPFLDVFNSPDRISLKNKIITSIEFNEVCSFDESIDHTSALLNFLGIMVGRPQNILELKIHCKSCEHDPMELNLYWSMPPKRNKDFDERHPHYVDILEDAVQFPKIFANILSNWINRHKTWKVARDTFYGSFSQQKYSIDRLIRSANIFDILPSSAVPPNVLLSENLKLAKEECTKIFKNLPKSPERDSVLSILGRIGKSNLKQKIRYRGKLLIDKVGDKFPDLYTITDEAVNCRNYFVHNSDPKFDYNNNFDLVIFFTETLEFIFVTSDLIECGWDIKKWIEKGNAMSQQLSEYCEKYTSKLADLHSLLVKVV